MSWPRRPADHRATDRSGPIQCYMYVQIRNINSKQNVAYHINSMPMYSTMHRLLRTVSSHRCHFTRSRTQLWQLGQRWSIEIGTVTLHNVLPYCSISIMIVAVVGFVCVVELQ